MGEAGEQGNVQRVLPLTAGVFLYHAAKPYAHLFLPVDNLLHVKGEIGAVVRIFIHILFSLFQFFPCGIFRRNENLNEFVHHIPVLLLVLHGEQIHLVVKMVTELGGLDVQCFIHKHPVILPVRSFVFGNHKLVLVLSEVQPADDTVQFVLLLISLPDGAANLIDKVLFKMLYRKCRLFLRCFPVFLQILAGERVQKFFVRLVALDGGRKGAVGISLQIMASPIN